MEETGMLRESGLFREHCPLPGTRVCLCGVVLVGFVPGPGECLMRPSPCLRPPGSPVADRRRSLWCCSRLRAATWRQHSVEEEARERESGDLAWRSAPH